MPKKKSKKVKKNGKGVGGKADVHAHEEGKRNKSLLGHNAIFTPEVIDDIHIKSQLGRYRMRGMALMKKIPTFDDLVFLPGTLTRFVIEGYREKCETKTVIGPRCENPIELDIPVYITGMSFGALSYEAKTALARGATMAGSATCSGEGGMIPDERRYSEKWYYQCIQSRYGFNPHHAQLADGIEVFIGQGQKVGMGGHLMGQKVTDQVAEMRSLPSGIDQRSPARHPDWLGPDDLALKVEELRQLTKNKVPIQLKLGASKVYDDVRMAAKCDPDSIYLDGMEGSTGAGPHIAAANTGIPGIAAIREARRAIDDVGKTGKVTLIYAGGVRDGADMAKALALGADAIAIGTGSMIALNCNKDIPEANFEKEMGVKAGECYHCHTGRCPVGVATQDSAFSNNLTEELNLIIKSDVHGSSEAIKNAISQIKHEEVKPKIILSDIGMVTETDVTLAKASNAVLIAFNVKPSKEAKKLAENENIKISSYNIIYEVLDYIKKRMSGLLAPDVKETIVGSAQILEIFKVSGAGKVAGSKVTEGEITSASEIRIIRDSKVIHTGKVGTLFREKNQVKQVSTGQECGITVKDYMDFQKNDIIEAFNITSTERSI